MSCRLTFALKVMERSEKELRRKKEGEKEGGSDLEY